MATEDRVLIRRFDTGHGGQVEEWHKPLSEFGGGAAVTWDSLQGKPATFTPSSHSHAISDVTGLQAALDGKQASGNYAASTHNHDGTYATAGHTHAATTLNARTSADRTTTATGMGNVTDLAIAIPANETWSFDAYLFGGCNNTGGSQFSVTVPAGATVRAQATGNTNAATGWTTGAITASDGASPTFFNVNATNRTVELHGVVVNGANAGNIQIRFKSVTNGQTTTVLTNSFVTARKH